MGSFPRSCEAGRGCMEKPTTAAQGSQREADGVLSHICARIVSLLSQPKSGPLSSNDPYRLHLKAV